MFWGRINQHLYRVWNTEKVKSVLAMEIWVEKKNGSYSWAIKSTVFLKLSTAVLEKF